MSIRLAPSAPPSSPRLASVLLLAACSHSRGTPATLDCQTSETRDAGAMPDGSNSGGGDAGSPMTFADLPDGKYYVMATTEVASDPHRRNGCPYANAQLVLDKHGGTAALTGTDYDGVAMEPVDSTWPVDPTTGTFDFKMPPTVPETRYAGTFTFSGHQLGITMQRTSLIFGDTSAYSGSVEISAFGPAVVPAGFIRASAASIEMLDGDWQLWYAEFARDSAGERYVSFPLRIDSAALPIGSSNTGSENFPPAICGDGIGFGYSPSQRQLTVHDGSYFDTFDVPSWF
jgi:hypothetical protein